MLEDIKKLFHETPSQNKKIEIKRNIESHHQYMTIVPKKINEMKMKFDDVLMLLNDQDRELNELKSKIDSLRRMGNKKMSEKRKRMTSIVINKFYLLLFQRKSKENELITQRNVCMKLVDEKKSVVNKLTDLNLMWTRANENSISCTLSQKEIWECKLAGKESYDICDLLTSPIKPNQKPWL